MWYNHKLKSNNIFSLHLEYMCTHLNNNIHDIIICKKVACVSAFEYMCTHLNNFQKKKIQYIF